eukprot:Awhi_evm1s14381
MESFKLDSSPPPPPPPPFSPNLKGEYDVNSSNKSIGLSSNGNTTTLNNGNTTTLNNFIVNNSHVSSSQRNDGYSSDHNINETIKNNNNNNLNQNNLYISSEANINKHINSNNNNNFTVTSNHENRDNNNDDHDDKNVHNNIDMNHDNYFNRDSKTQVPDTSSVRNFFRSLSPPPPPPLPSLPKEEKPPPPPPSNIMEQSELATMSKKNPKMTLITFEEPMIDRGDFLRLNSSESQRTAPLLTTKEATTKTTNAFRETVNKAKARAQLLNSKSCYPNGARVTRDTTKDNAETLFLDGNEKLEREFKFTQRRVPRAPKNIKNTGSLETAESVLSKIAKVKAESRKASSLPAFAMPSSPSTFELSSTSRKTPLRNKGLSSTSTTSSSTLPSSLSKPQSASSTLLQKARTEEFKKRMASPNLPRALSKFDRPDHSLDNNTIKSKYKPTSIPLTLEEAIARNAAVAELNRQKKSEKMKIQNGIAGEKHKAKIKAVPSTPLRSRIPPHATPTSISTQQLQQRSTPTLSRTTLKTTTSPRTLSSASSASKSTVKVKAQKSAVQQAAAAAIKRREQALANKANQAVPSSKLASPSPSPSSASSYPASPLVFAGTNLIEEERNGELRKSKAAAPKNSNNDENLDDDSDDAEDP